MNKPKIVLVAEWDGWCGACAAERPLVLTRTGRQGLRTWLTGAADDSRPLVLTCRLCGTGVDVPLERDDPPVAVSTAEPALPEPTPVVESVQGAVAAATPSSAPVPRSADELATGRQAVASALGALLAQRSAASLAEAAPRAVPVLGAAFPAVPLPHPSPVPVEPPVVAPSVPLQRTPSSGGLAELQLLADGIDLLSSGRA